MRTRPTPDARTADVARRRLEALTAELAAARGEAPVAVHDPDDPDAAGPSEAAGVGVAPSSGGRHARRPVPVARRFADRAADLTPGGVGTVAALRPHLGAAQMGLVALVVALGLLLSAWWLVRASGEGPGEVVPPRVNATAPASPSPPTAPTQPSSSTQPAATTQPGAGESIVVDVVGKVRRPGIAVLPRGARVADAVEAAGGVRRGVDPASVNMARLLSDGEQVVVGAPVGQQAPAPSPVAGTTPGGLVSLNTADQAALESLPGVGPVTAAAILEWRAAHGAFTSVDELLEVSGIGEATLAEIARHVTL
jgi:competence protein ComEA